jgi:hypothetical protein
MLFLKRADLPLENGKPRLNTQSDRGLNSGNLCQIFPQKNRGNRLVSRSKLELGTWAATRNPLGFAVAALKADKVQFRALR